MSSVITLHNLPPTLSQSMLEVILTMNQIRWKETIMDTERSTPDELVAHVILLSAKNLGFTLATMRECEISDRMVEPERASEEIQELIKKQIQEKLEAVQQIQEKTEAVQRKELDDWVHEYITMDDLTPESMNFASMDLHETVYSNLERLGFIQATPIQALSIPPAKEGRDVIGKAQTGTGKTLAFALPMIERFIDDGGGQSMRGLILTPTRELAIQIHDVIIPVIEGTGLSVVVVYGGDSIQDQMLKLMDGADIVVATPGRLLDLQERRRIRIDSAEMLVLDEADRMLDLGFQPQLDKILRAFYEHPQTLMYSATISKSLRKLMSSMMHNPVYVEVSQSELLPLDAITQESKYVHIDDKFEYLLAILKKEDGPVIIFANMRRSVEKLYQRLKSKGHRAVRVHGDISQPDRNRAVQGFKKGVYNILVATDVAARGLDIEGVAHVINFDLSETPEDHLHRIGRTARAGATGKATTFLQHDKKKKNKDFKSVLGLSS